MLKFKESSEHTIKLEPNKNHSHGFMRGEHSFNFRKIEYHNKHTDIDFFRSIGRASKIKLKDIWYSDDNGKLSICSEHLNNNSDEWMDRYWTNFEKSVSIKLKEWEYEKEYRLIINGNLDDLAEKNKRKFNYNFNDLEAIIFGIKTNSTDKIKILKIIEEKCRRLGRMDFVFYQAYYSSKTGKIETQKINLIDFK